MRNTQRERHTKTGRSRVTELETRMKTDMQDFIESMNRNQILDGAKEKTPTIIRSPVGSWLYVDNGGVQNETMRKCLTGANGQGQLCRDLMDCIGGLIVEWDKV